MKKVLSATDQPDFSKEIIASLSPEQLQAIEGGAAAGVGTSCIAATCHGTGLTDRFITPDEAAD